MRQTLYLGITLALVATGCAHPTDNSDIGVAAYHVTQSATGVEITGVDANGATIARAVLARNADGQTLTIDIGTRHVVHEDDASRPVSLPLLPGEESHMFNAFVQDPTVTAALAPWDVTFRVNNHPAPQSHTGERPLDSCMFQASCSVHACCAVPYDTGGNVGEEEFVCCSNHVFVDRECTGRGYDDCGTEGPGGCAVCWSDSWTNWCESFSDGNACDYSYN